MPFLTLNNHLKHLWPIYYEIRDRYLAIKLLLAIIGTIVDEKFDSIFVSSSLIFLLERSSVGGGDVLVMGEGTFSQHNFV